MAKVLIIDEENTIRLLYKEEFQDEGYEVAVAASYEEAREKIRQNKPDIIALDINIPERDGFEFVKKLKETDIPMVFCTDYCGQQDGWASDTCVVKSANLTELKKIVKKILKEKPLDKTLA